MSSPVNDDHHDKQYMYAPPWARDTARETPEAIVAAIEQLRLQRQRAATPAVETGEAAPREAVAGQSEPPFAASSDPSDIEAAMANAIRASKWTPRSLDPVAMPDPPKPRMDGPTWGMALRLCGAVTAAAVVALFVTGAFRLPSIGFSLGAGTGAAASSAIAQAQAAGDTRLTPQPIVVTDASPAVPSGTPAAAAPSLVIVSQPAPAPPSAVPSDVLTAYASLDAQPAAASLKAKSDDSVGAKAVPKLSDVRALDHDELAGLVKRGQALLAEGDIASARLLLRRVAEAGDANAALLLAGSYDRAELARLKVIGVASDPAQAKIWYAKAVEHGSAEAVRRLQQLAQRGE